MATKRTKSEASLLEKYRVSLENVEKQPAIAAVMAEYGYGPEKITEGKNLLSETRQAYNANRTEDDESAEAYNQFSTKRELLKDTYGEHRKKAKVVFRNEPLTLEKLGIVGAIPGAYVRLMETVRTFYGVALDNADIQARLSRLRVSPEDLTAGQALAADVDNARAAYLREKGESQDATKTKDAAFAKMDDWMSEFYAVARIALEDKPQLLEALDVLVRS